MDTHWIPAPSSTHAETTATQTPVVIYLQGLAVPRVGTVPDATLLAEFTAAGFSVLQLDYRNDPRSVLPSLVDDLVKLRADLHAGTLLAGESIDPNRIFIVPAGCRLLRDVAFGRSPKRTLAFDLIYPAAPLSPVGTVLEFSCDNQDRMGNASLAFCTDALLPIAALAGHAAVMADHPVDPPYKGLDPMPESVDRARAAVLALRNTIKNAGVPLNGRVVPAGFSRGSGMALALAIAPNAALSVQGAIVMSGRFTYLNLRNDDPMIPRYNTAWGTRETSLATWRLHGALDVLDRPLPMPLFLTINPTESPHALHQMDVLRQRLTELRSPFVYAPETSDRGHRMPVEPAVITALLDYLRAQLAP